MRRFGRRAPAAARRRAARRYGFRLTESAKAAGLDFVHEAPTLDPKLAHIMPQVSVDGRGGVGRGLRPRRPPGPLRDQQQGGLAEPPLPQPRRRHLRGRGRARWASPTSTGPRPASRWARSGATTTTTASRTCSSTGGAGPELFRNDGGRAFARVTEAAGLPAWANVNTAVWLDFDRDGQLDLFLGGYYAERVNLWKLADTKIMPESFEYAKNGGRKYLYRNLGGGRFEEVSEKLGLASRRWALAAVAADLRGTGYPDLFIANDYGVSELFVNEGGRFREVGRETGVGYAPKSGMNASVGDVLNQGRFAIYVSNISEEGILLQGNNLWVPTGDRERPAAVREHGDRDGRGPRRLELRRAVRRPQQRRPPGPLPRQRLRERLEGGELLVRLLEDRRRPRARDLRRQELAAHGRRAASPGTSRRRSGSTTAPGSFLDVAPMVGVDRPPRRPLRGAGRPRQPRRARRGGGQPARAAAPVPQRRGARAATGSRSSSRAAAGRTRPPRRCTNRSAIGAQVTRPLERRQQVQEVSGGSGFCAQNQRRLHFGLGPGAVVEKAVVRWPSGKTEELPRPAANRAHELKEPA